MSGRSVVLPKGWVEKYSDKKAKYYYVNTATKATQWTFPVEEPSSVPSTNSMSSPAPSTAPAPAVVAAVVEEWVELFSEKKQRPYWKNTITNESTWKKPPSLLEETTAPAPAEPTQKVSKAAPEATQAKEAEVWQEKYSDKKQKPYWKNTVTGESTWTNPLSNAASSSSATPAAVAASTSTSAPEPAVAMKLTAASLAAAAAAAPQETKTQRQAPIRQEKKEEKCIPDHERPLPDGWKIKYSESKGKHYYVNTSNKKTQWTYPEEEAAQEKEAKEAADAEAASAKKASLSTTAPPPSPPPPPPVVSSRVPPPPPPPPQQTGGARADPNVASFWKQKEVEKQEGATAIKSPPPPPPSRNNVAAAAAVFAAHATHAEPTPVAEVKRSAAIQALMSRKSLLDEEEPEPDPNPKRGHHHLAGLAEGDEEDEEYDEPEGEHPDLVQKHKPREDPIMRQMGSIIGEMGRRISIAPGMQGVGHAGLRHVEPKK